MNVPATPQFHWSRWVCALLFLLRQGQSGKICSCCQGSCKGWWQVLTAQSVELIKSETTHRLDWWETDKDWDITLGVIWIGLSLDLSQLYMLVSLHADCSFCVFRAACHSSKGNQWTCFLTQSDSIGPFNVVRHQNLTVHSIHPSFLYFGLISPVWPVHKTVKRHIAVVNKNKAMEWTKQSKIDLNVEHHSEIKEGRLISSWFHYSHTWCSVLRFCHLYSNIISRSLNIFWVVMILWVNIPQARAGLHFLSIYATYLSVCKSIYPFTHATKNWLKH